jgi:hypothetical protein
MTNQQALIDSRSDAALARHVATVVSRPRSGPSNSFVLHAPLEVAARYGLLSFVEPERRPDARSRLLDVARDWEAHSPEVPEPTSAPSAPSDPVAALHWALDAGDPETADAAAIEIARWMSADALAGAIGDAVVPLTSAAAHAAIFLHLLPRVAPRQELPVALVRPLVRELAAFPDWRLRWIDQLEAAPVDGNGLFEALASTPFVGQGPSPFIHPMLLQVDPTGVAQDVLAGRIPSDDLAGARRSILRAAALSMLNEPDQHAAYGWSHCLTMPLGVLGIADRLRDPARAIAIAATYVVGFRATLATRPIVERATPLAEAAGWRDSFASGSNAAAAAVRSAARRDPEEYSAIVETLATMAAVHPDAHLAKYTLACFDAAAIDPAASDLYLAACAHLHGVWATGPEPWSD